MYAVLNNEIEAEVGLGFHESSFKGGRHSASVHTRALDPPSCLEGGCDGSDSSNYFVIIIVKVIPYRSRGESWNEPGTWTTSWGC